jgi:hypothetical protein
MISSTVRLWVLVLAAFILEQMVSQALFLAPFVTTFDSLLNNKALCFSTSVNSVCSSDSEKFGLLFLLILVQKYRIYYTNNYVQNNGQTKSARFYPLTLLNN